MPRLVSRADLAKRANVSRAAVTNQCKRALAPACEGDRVDLDHPAAQAFLRAHGAEEAPPPPKAARAPTKVTKRDVWVPDEQTETHEAPPKRRVKPTARRRENERLPPQPPNAGSQEDLGELNEYLRPLLERFGTERGFRDWLVGLKDIEIIDGKRLENEATRGLRIPREFVTVHLLSFLEETSKRLLSDMPKTLSARLFALSRSGATHVEAESEVRSAVSSHLEAVNKKISKSLRDLARRATETNAGTDGGGSELAGGAVRNPHNKPRSTKPKRMG